MVVVSIYERLEDTLSIVTLMYWIIRVPYRCMFTSVSQRTVHISHSLLLHGAQHVKTELFITILDFVL